MVNSTTCKHVFAGIASIRPDRAYAIESSRVCRAMLGPKKAVGRTGLGTSIQAENVFLIRLRCCRAPLDGHNDLVSDGHAPVYDFETTIEIGRSRVLVHAGEVLYRTAHRKGGNIGESTYNF